MIALKKTKIAFVNLCSDPVHIVSRAMKRFVALTTSLIQ